MQNFEDRYRQLGAELHGGAPVRRTTPLPPPSIPAPAVPTATMTIDGIEIHPAKRLTALAALRDGHRGRARAASDRGHALREQAMEFSSRADLIEARLRVGADAQAEGEVQVIRAHAEQLRAAAATAQDEAAAETEAAGAADRVFKSALKFCDDHGITVSVLYSGERR